MADFQFLQNKLAKQWVILAPRRASRPTTEKTTNPICPFCVGREKEEVEIFRIGGEPQDINWQVRVIPNKYPFAMIHEIIIHSPDHHKNFEELPLDHVQLILQTYRQRFLALQDKGDVFIFHNHGELGGESLAHPHSQLVVIPSAIEAEMPPYETPTAYEETSQLVISCPITSQWPDEVWIAPKKNNTFFGEITDAQIEDFSQTLVRLIDIFDLRHGHEFPYNFYIYPKKNWYVRLTPRAKSLGGFEIGTNIYVNTQDPSETLAFIKEHFHNPDREKIQTIHKAAYSRGV